MQIDHHLDTTSAGGTKLGQVIFAAITQNKRLKVETKEEKFALSEDRLHLIIEEFDFTVYVEECLKLAHCAVRNMSRISERFLMVIDHITKMKGTMPYRQPDNVGDSKAIDIKKYSGFPNCGLIKLLKRLACLSEKVDVVQYLKIFADEFETDLKSDALITQLVSTGALCQHLDMVCENSDVFVSKVLHLHSDNHFLQEYVAAAVGSMVTQFDYTPIGVKEFTEGNDSIKWDKKTEEPKLAKGVQQFNLVIFDMLLNVQQDMTHTICRVSQVIAENGFVLVRFPIENFHLNIVLYSFLTSWRTREEVELYDDSCYFASKATWINLFESLGFVVVSVKSDGYLSALYLLRKRTKKVKLHNQSVIEVGDLNDRVCYDLMMEEIRRRKKKADGRLWLVSHGQSFSGLVGLTRSLLKDEATSHVRFV